MSQHLRENIKPNQNQLIEAPQRRHWSGGKQALQLDWESSHRHMLLDRHQLGSSLVPTVALNRVMVLGWEVDLEAPQHISELNSAIAFWASKNGRILPLWAFHRRQYLTNYLVRKASTRAWTASESFPGNSPCLPWNFSSDPSARGMSDDDVEMLLNWWPYGTPHLIVCVSCSGPKHHYVKHVRNVFVQNLLVSAFCFPVRKHHSLSSMHSRHISASAQVCAGARRTSKHQRGGTLENSGEVLGWELSELRLRVAKNNEISKEFTDEK